MLERVEVYSGFAVRQTGQTVSAGEVLVSHAYTDERTGIITTGRARANVVALTVTTYRSEQPLNYSAQLPTGTVYTENTLQFGNVQIPLYRKTSEPAQYRENTILVAAAPLGWALPLSISQRTVTELQNCAIELTEEAAARRARLACDEFIAQEMAGAEIHTREYAEMIEDGKAVCTVTVSASEQIGETVEIG